MPSWSHGALPFSVKGLQAVGTDADVDAVVVADGVATFVKMPVIAEIDCRSFLELQASDCIDVL